MPVLLLIIIAARRTWRRAEPRRAAFVGLAYTVLTAIKADSSPRYSVDRLSLSLSLSHRFLLHGLSFLTFDAFATRHYEQPGVDKSMTTTTTTILASDIFQSPLLGVKE